MSAPQSLFDRHSAQAVPFGTGLRALILDDSEVDRTRIRRICRQADLDIEFTQAATISDFAACLDAPAFDVVFLDYFLVQGDGLIALDMLRRHPTQKKAAAIMIAGEGQIQIAIDALKNGCSDYILKDNIGPDLMIRTIRNAMEAHSARAAVETGDPASGAEASLARFAHSCGSEMRSILSSMLRRIRAMRHEAAGGVAFDQEDFAGIEGSCQKLWVFLEEYQAFIAEGMKPKTNKIN